MNSQRFSFQIWRQFLFLCLILFGLGVNSFAAPGDLDTSFGNGGFAFSALGITNSTQGPYGNSLAIQPDGKIVVAGGRFFPANGGGIPVFSPVISRFLPNGAVDSSFGTNGAIFEPFGLFSEFNSVKIQPDGKIVAAGYVYNGGSETKMLIIRYNPDGSRDTSFGGLGFVLLVFNLRERANDLIIQPDGKIIAAGFTCISQECSFALARVNSDGSLDASFGVGGKVTTGFNSNSTGITSTLLQPDGKLIVGGSAGDIAFARYNSDGSLDNTFNGNGKVVIDNPNGNSGLSQIVLQSDGKIVGAGQSQNTDTDSDIILVRLNQNGNLDSSFGSGGIVKTSFSNGADAAKALLIQPNGKLIVIGRSGERTPPAMFVSLSNIALAKYNSDGSMDNSFGQAGKVVTYTNQYYATPNSAKLLPDGKIIVTGTSFINGIRNIFLARYLNNLTSAAIPAYDFDGDGKSDISVFRDGIWHLQRSQAGFGAVYWGLASDKIAPADFDGDGKTDPTVYRPSNGEWSILRSSDNTATVLRFGAPEDLPRPADFDGDGKADITVFRPSNGTWYRINSSNNQFYAVQFGAAGDAPVVADFDGDDKADIAVYRPSNGTWYWLRSSDGHFAAVQFGISEDKPVPADYDGDGKADVAVFRPSNGTWYLQRSSLGFTGMQFGISTDKPAPADYDGDGKADIAVFRDGTWYLQRSTAGFTGVGFGDSTDKPIANAFIP
ncbi:MAG: FG-GAP-like repeat-containing protein [Pyrinomonadaceae bacterium]